MIVPLLFVAFLFMGNTDCGNPKAQATSDSGVKKASATIQTQANGNTVEQNNIIERLKRDNDVGSVKHLYIISAYSGQVLIYSTVKGKVTSSGKRLTPKTVIGGYEGANGWYGGQRVNINGQRFRTHEVIQDDGTYGNSVHYLYWFDQAGVYHQHYVSGGQIVHISDQPIQVKSVVINMEVQK